MRAQLLHVAAGFTILELMIVIVIIGFLVALLLPAIQSSTETARRLQCANHFRQAGIALHNHYEAKGRFPPGLVMWSSASNSSCGPRPTLGGQSGFGWAAYLLPYFEEKELYQTIDFGKNFFDASSGNRRTIGHFIAGYLCPSDPQGAELVFCCSGWTNGQSLFENAGNTNMAGVADVTAVTCDGTWPKHFVVATGLMAERIGASTAKIPDGLSKTFILGEVTGDGPGTFLGNFWASWNVKSTLNGINGPGTIPGGDHWSSYLNSGFSSFHLNGCHFMMADGSVHFISAQTEHAVITALTTRAGGESVSLP